MKMKLAGLLLFSQAAEALTIDKTNYTTYLCDDNILKINPVLSENIPKHLGIMQEAIIELRHDYYCEELDKYYEAESFYKTHDSNSKMDCSGNNEKKGQPINLMSGRECLDKHGTILAQTCEQLKQDKESMPSSWNTVASKRLSCG